MATVEFRNISKSFGAVTVLHELDLTIGKGEFIVLLGPSGCGKTTLLNILAGLVDASGGHVLIDGRDVTDLDPRDRGLAMVFQSYALYPTKTVRGNLKFGLDARGLSSQEVARRIAWAAKLLQIEHLLDRKPAQLSGGQRQRVAIGRALVKQVGVCLFDEPLSNLDAKLRTEMRMEIKKLHGELGNTVVYVTHDQVEAMTMATRIAVMNKGVIQQIGTPDQIYDEPENLFVADFIGSPSMNFFDAVIMEKDGRTAAFDAANLLTFDLEGCAFRSPPRDGRRVCVGIRPEHIRVGTDGGYEDKAIRLDLRASYFEKIGSEAVAYLGLPEALISVRMSREQAIELQQVDTVPIQLPARRLKLFDADTGARL